MRMAELSAESGVPVPTIKYYLREGLLPQGERTSRTQASYGRDHVRRLRVIRALIDAGVGITGARKVLDTLDDPPPDAPTLLGAAHAAVTPSYDSPVSSPVSAEAEELVERLGLPVATCDQERLADVSRALEILRDAGFEVPPAVMSTYLRSIKDIATAEVADVPAEGSEEAVRYVVLGTALAEPLLLALRRVAQQAATAERFSTGG
ncbi:MerR family transcriptional regulator [Streptomyces regensis]|uniref:MerR-like DNA binding protein n=2 Tax=Prauserella rugosa TaxID=43354 RepID=A0A660CBL6_9PSEU|nr:MerR family transcriptional regulator [Streptomyces regensis]TWH20872.1 MerR-like DNA binding protein [Prauserella rugosa]